jgi:hypothetical protein
MKANQVIIHGECMVFKSKIPANAKKLDNVKNYLIVAPSETTGNHHVVDNVPGVTFYQDDKGVMYMENETDTQIRCIVADRHDAITIKPGTYEFGSQQEYDPFTARMQKVRD